MGTHANYNKMIRTILLFRNRLRKPDNELQRTIYNYFIQLESNIDNDYWDDDIPTNIKISQSLNIPRIKLNKYIKTFYNEVLGTTYTVPLKTSKCIHCICISYDYNELRNAKNKAYAEELINRETVVYIELAITPAIGDYISFDFIDDGFGFNSGFVYDVKHQFDGINQEITVFANPYKRLESRK